MKALDEALVARVVHLFGVLSVAGDLDEGLPRFEKGLARAIETYDLVKAKLVTS
jgi:hypothetical protein